MTKVISSDILQQRVWGKETLLCAVIVTSEAVKCFCTGTLLSWLG